jgi:hypothetical protein
MEVEIQRFRVREDGIHLGGGRSSLGRGRQNGTDQKNRQFHSDGILDERSRFRQGRSSSFGRSFNVGCQQSLNDIRENGRENVSLSERGTFVFKECCESAVSRGFTGHEIGTLIFLERPIKSRVCWQ